MAFVDELELAARAGNGGDGVVRWLHLKGQEYSGPSGGNGGNGGDVYIRAVRDLNLLARYRGEKKFKGGDGDAGGNRMRGGKGGEDLIIDLPIGSLVRNTNTGEVFDLVSENQKIQILKGGRGGAGNTVFKSSVNRSPSEFTPGQKGESAVFKIELRIIADAGFIGLPNAGKTSLLNVLTSTSAKVASYAFTTLDPNLGALYEYVLADIPGLIEGASGGKGLGFQFLRHISRTRVLIHCVSLESETPFEDYETVRKELREFEGGELINKPEMIILTKSDTREPEYLKQISAKFKKINKDLIAVTVLEDASVKKLGDHIMEVIQKRSLAAEGESEN